MRLTTIMLLLLPALLILGPAAGAQNPKAQYADTIAQLKKAPPEQRAKFQSDLMKTRLQLTDAQYRQVSAINLFYARKMDPILHSTDSRFSKYRQARPLLEEKDGKLKAVFTRDQLQRYEDFKKEMKEKMRKAA